MRWPSYSRSGALKVPLCTFVKSTFAKQNVHNMDYLGIKIPETNGKF